MSNYKLNNLICSLSLMTIVVAELLIFNGIMISAILIHMINFLFIVLIIIFVDLNIDTKKILQGFMLLILLRIVNFSIPKFFTVVLFQYILIYGIMFVPIYYTIKDQTAKDLSITFNNIIVYIPLGIMIGTLLSLIEYIIINPIALINKLNFSNILLIIIIMFAFIGMVEETIFRPILQTRLNNIIGLRYSILVSGLLFGIMHSGYGKINEILFASIIGVFIGYLFHRTKSLPFTVTIHGTTNVILFGILPLLNRF